MRKVVTLFGGLLLGAVLVGCDGNKPAEPPKDMQKLPGPPGAAGGAGGKAPAPGGNTGNQQGGIPGTAAE